MAYLQGDKGYRFIFDPNVKFYEYAASTNEGRVKQKTIRGANLIKVLWFFKDMFLKRKYGKFGMITLPFNFAMLAFAPISILIGFSFPGVVNDFCTEFCNVILDYFRYFLFS